jgi:hypothetical protein
MLQFLLLILFSSVLDAKQVQAATTFFNFTKFARFLNFQWHIRNMPTKKAGALIIKPPLTPEMEKTVDEFIRAFKQPVEGLKEKIECQVKYSESKEKGFDDDIERVEKVIYTFYDESSHEPLFEIRLENHSHTGKMARVAINSKF